MTHQLNMQTDKQMVMSKLKRVSKMFHKLTGQIELLTNIMEQHQEKKPETIIIDEADFELIISSPEPPGPSIDPKEEAQKLLQRFYYRIRAKMDKNQINQIEALRLLGKKNHHGALYQNLFQGFKTLFFDDDFQCKVCQIKLQSDQLCIKHAKNEHLNDLKFFLCIKCLNSFQKLELLEKHIEQEHNIKHHFKKPQPEPQPKQMYLIQKQNQKLDIQQYSQQIQSQPILKKVFVPNKHSSESEKLDSMFNQVYTGVENLESQKQTDQIEEIVYPKKTQKLKIKILPPSQNNESKTIN